VIITGATDKRRQSLGLAALDRSVPDDYFKLLQSMEAADE